jgi:hypothetical protein
MRLRAVIAHRMRALVRVRAAEIREMCVKPVSRRPDTGLAPISASPRVTGRQ